MFLQRRICCGITCNRSWNSVRSKRTATLKMSVHQNSKFVQSFISCIRSAVAGHTDGSCGLYQLRTRDKQIVSLLDTVL